MVRTLEVWHGGIPTDAPSLPRCAGPECGELGGHSHTQRISDQPFGIPWGLWVTYHMDTPPSEIIHVNPDCPRCHGEGEFEVGTAQDEFGNWDTETYECPGCPDCFDSSAVSREGESKAAGPAPVSVGGEDQPSAGAHLGRSDG